MRVAPGPPHGDDSDGSTLRRPPTSPLWRRTGVRCAGRAKSEVTRGCCAMMPPGPGAAEEGRATGDALEDAGGGAQGNAATSASGSHLSWDSLDVSDSSAGRTAPVYQSAWDGEFKRETFSPGAIRFLASVAALYHLYSSGRVLLDYRTSAGGGFDWALRAAAPRMAGAIKDLLVLSAFCVPVSGVRRFCVRYYDQLCAVWILSSHVLDTVHYLVMDLRNFATGGGGHGEPRFRNVSFGQVGWFVRECTDADPERTLLLPSHGGMQPGCSSNLASGDAMFMLCVFLLMPILLRIDKPRAWATAITALFSYVVLCMSVGYANWSFFWSLMLQTTAAVSASLLCQWKERHAKREFAQVVAMRFAAYTKQNLLHTLIPPNVLKKLSGDKHNAYPAQPISMCTVMFCMFDYAVKTRDDFDFIESLIADLDRAVEQSGMFKYQHVCCGSCHNFIVTCPRASMPDVEDGEAAYPASKYYDDMLSLGFDLMYATEKKARAPSFFGIETDTERDVPARARNLVMKVGLSSGPAAGVVLGACRRFYCIYGDTVNTAARMCKFSNPGTIRVTQDIGIDPVVSNSNWFQSVSQGPVVIKGKGQMAVYDISLNRTALIQRHASVRMAIAKTRTFHRASFTLKNSASELPAASAAQEKQWRTWLKTRHRLSRILPTFSDTETEHAYQKSSSHILVKRRGLTMGILFHLVSCTWQWAVIASPDHGVTYFHAHANPKLDWRMDTAMTLLMVQFLLSVAVGCIVFFLLDNISITIEMTREFLIRNHWISDTKEWTLGHELSEARDLAKKPRSAPSRHTVIVCEVLYVLLKLFNVGIALGLSFVWPSRRNQGVKFSLYSLSGYCLSHTIFGTSFESNTVMALVSLPVAFVSTSLPLQKSISGLNFTEDDETLFSKWRSTFLISVAFAFVASVGASRFLSLHARMTWSRDKFQCEQLQTMQRLLLDLVPPVYAKQLIVGCRHIECAPGRVAVLQLDICNFTVISQSLTPTKLADILNSLVSDFDKFVLKHKLTKIDTIGDAYIVVGWLLSDNEDDEGLNERNEETSHRRCVDMLKVADGILSCIDEHRERTGVELHARIGIATGDVISGVLGLLQPRFCVFGEGMCRAAELEQTGSKDSVHCSPEFMDYLRTSQARAVRRRASFSAEMHYEFSKTQAAKRMPKNCLQRKFKSGALVSRMMDEGRLYTQQNMMTAEPAVSIAGFEPIRPARGGAMTIPESGEGPFGLGKSIDEHGNLLSRGWFDQHLRSIDENGMLTMRGKSSVLDREPVLQASAATLPLHESNDHQDASANGLLKEAEEIVGSFPPDIIELCEEIVTGEPLTNSDAETVVQTPSVV